MYEHVSLTIDPNKARSLIDFLMAVEDLNFLVILAIKWDATESEWVEICQLMDNMQRRNILSALYVAKMRRMPETSFALLLSKGAHPRTLEIASLLRERVHRLSLLSRDDLQRLGNYFVEGGLSYSNTIIVPSRFVPFVSSSSDDERWLSTEDVNEYKASCERAAYELRQQAERHLGEMPFLLRELHKDSLGRIVDEEVQRFYDRTHIRMFPLAGVLKSRCPFLSVLVRMESLGHAYDNALKQIVCQIQSVSHSSGQPSDELPSQSYRSTHSSIFLGREVYYYRNRPVCSQDDVASTPTKVTRYTAVPQHNDEAERPLDESRQQVDSAVFAPLEAKRGDTMMVQVFLYTESDSEEVKAKAKMVDKDAEKRNYTPLDIPLKRADRVEVAFSLTDPSVEIDEPVQTLTWTGRVTSAEFCVFVPEGYSRSTLVGKVLLSVNGFPVGRMKFVTSLVEKVTLLHAPITISRFRKIFMSYSHLDSQSVTSMAEAFRMLGTVDYFFDRHSLETGKDFEKYIEEYINSSDAFVLFWSENAAGSAWVEKEYMLALKQRDKIGEDKFVFHPLHIEPHAEPPEVLRRLHFSELQYPSLHIP